MAGETAGICEARRQTMTSKITKTSILSAAAALFLSTVALGSTIAPAVASTSPVAASQNA
jgi:hypothetical protein